MVDSMSTDSAKPEFINLNVHKAGLDGLDQQRINQIIQEASKGSNFYTFQQRRQKRINEQIEQLKKRANSITDVQRQQAMKKADMIIADLEQRRVLNKIIVHFDMDMFFAAVEIKKDPSLADVPMAVGSLSMISTSNYIARRFGVRSAMAGFIAKKLCPQLKLIKPNFKNYAAESEFVMNIIRQYDPNLRTFSLDEVFIDLTDFVFDGYSKKNNVPLEDLYCMDVLSDDIWQFTNEVVTEIRAKVHEESRLTVSAGIACNTLLAKVCTDINKPNGQFMVKGQREEIMDFVSQIQIRKFTGIGPVRDQILSAFNIVKPTDLFNERVLLSCLFGDIDYYLRVYLGIGSTHLSNNESVQQKSHSRERTVGEMSNFDDICHLLKDISHRLSNDLKNEQQICKTITLKLKKINFEMFIKCKTIDHYTDDEQIVFRVGKELLSQEMQKSPQNKYRLIGLKVSNLCNISNANDKVVLPSDQLTLSKFFQTSTKRKAIESEPDSTHSIDQIDDSSDSNFNENGELECNLCERTFTRITKFRYHRQFCRGNTGDSMYGLSSDSDDDDDCDGDEPPARLSFTRRKSVFAEHYDPEEDEGDTGTKIFYPKSDEQRQRLGEATKNILLFRSLDPTDMNEVIDAMFERKVEANEVVIKQGDDGDNFYVIADGTFSITVANDDGTEKEVGKYVGSGSFGELALMYNMPRAATVRAVTAGSLWAMSRQTFRRIVLKRAFMKRKEYESFIEKVEIFKFLEYYEKMSLSDAFMARCYKNGDLIIKQGDQADGMYFVQEGIVRIIKEENGQEQELSRVEKGGYFGELALITKKSRAATVYAASAEVKLAFLDVLAFERLLGPCMNIMRRNFNHYEDQLVKLFGSKSNVTDLR
ncbi:uncharacterized protein LOC124498371 [Dermatophagoides farinae]|uniref:uncharacterized protein LOC124498371 n=1 Tax=Dermatophagoides farinae TaxID=6954 RepID=UPI003F5F3D94